MKKEAKVTFTLSESEIREALIKASEKARTKTHEEYLFRAGVYEYSQDIDKKSILNAYPIELIT